MLEFAFVVVSAAQMHPVVVAFASLRVLLIAWLTLSLSHDLPVSLDLSLSLSFDRSN